MIFDLLFVVAFLGSIATFVVAVVAALRGRGRRTKSILIGYGMFAAVYLGAVVAVSLISPQRVLAIGNDRCFDDWCVAVEDVTFTRALGQGDRAVTANGVFYVVRLRLSNHGHGRPQRASSAAVHLIDGRGQRYDASRQGQDAFEAQRGPAPLLTSTIPVGQPVNTVQVFDLPKDARNVGLTIEHPVGLSPAVLVIGDDASLFHKPTIVRLNPHEAGR